MLSTYFQTKLFELSLCWNALKGLEWHRMTQPLYPTRDCSLKFVLLFLFPTEIVERVHFMRILKFRWKEVVC